MSHPVLANPPIQEAIATIHFAEEVSRDTFAKFIEDDSIRARYNIQKQPSLLVEIGVSSETSSTGVKMEAGTDGYLAYDVDRQRVALQLRPSSVSVHFLKDYKEFDELMTTFSETWTCLNKSGVVPPVRKVGLRYINKIEGRPTADRFNLFLNTPFDELRSNNVFLQMRVNHESGHQVYAVITQAIQTNEKAAEASTILDIDTQMEYDSGEVPDLAVTFPILRSFKNDLFFSIVTSEALTPYL